MLWGPLFLPSQLQTFLVVAQVDLPFETVCVLVGAPAVFETTRASGDMVSLVGPHLVS